MHYIDYYIAFVGDCYYNNYAVTIVNSSKEGDVN